MTVVEILIVLVVTGIVLAAATPAMRDMASGFRYRNTVHEMASRLFLARQLAVRTGNPSYFVLDPQESSYLVFSDDDGNGVRDPSERQLGPFAFDPAIRIENVDFTDNSIMFLPNGTTSASGTLRIGDGHGRSRLISISSITGHVGVDQ